MNTTDYNRLKDNSIIGYTNMVFGISMFALFIMKNDNNHFYVNGKVL